MSDLPNFDLLEFARRYLVDMMLVDGMSPEVVERLITNMPYSNPLRELFSLQLIEALPEELKADARKRLLDNHVSPVVGVSIRAQDHGYYLPFSAHMNTKQIDSMVERVFDTDRVKKKSRMRDC